MFVAGSQVAGGLIGPTPSLTDLEDGDLKLSLDFRQVYATLLELWPEVTSKEALGGSFELLRSSALRDLRESQLGASNN